MIRIRVLYFLSMALLMGCKEVDKPSATVERIEIPPNIQNQNGFIIVIYFQVLLLNITRIIP